MEKEYPSYFIPGFMSLATTEILYVNNEKKRKKTLAT